MPIDRERRQADLQRRLRSSRDDGRRHCWVFGCRNPPGNVSGDGLGRFCRKHLEHHRRHGDPEKPTYRAAEVNPYRVSAAKWIKSNSDHQLVKSALKRVDALMRGAGRNVEVRDLKRAPPVTKARAMWARLREHNVPAVKILSAILGTVMCNAADPDPRKREFRHVQIAKVLARMAGGQTKRWQTHYVDPTLPKTQTVSWYVASEGKVLREIGKKAEGAAEFLVPDKIGELLNFHNARIESR